MGDTPPHDDQDCTNPVCRPCADAAERALVLDMAGVDDATAARLGF